MVSKLTKYPVFILLLVICSLYIFQFSNGNRLENTFESDTRGYYAFLPTLFIFNDPSYTKTLEAEQLNTARKQKEQFYLYKSKNGNVVNKYFPGIAVMQVPFFGLACLSATVFGQELDGYAFVFRLFFQIGAVFYFLLGIQLAIRFLNQFFPETRTKNAWYFILLLFSTPLWYYGFNGQGFSHLYSFFLFTVFANLILLLKEKPNPKYFIYLAVCLGLIALVRPTNLVVILLIPFLLQSKKETRLFFSALFSGKGRIFILAGITFLSIVSIQLLSWKWQTGNWLEWSYNGEGFNFFHAYFTEVLFSFRIGLFVHTPILILALIAALSYFRNRGLAAFFFVSYFLLNTWIISAWWCWDYESPFGSRAFTEHLFFLVLPLFYFLGKFPRITLILSFCFLALQSIRYYERMTGFMSIQRFTSENYFESLAFWNPENRGRWQFTESCEPFGERINSHALMYTDDTLEIRSENLYSFPAVLKLKENRTNERYYYRFSVEKFTNESDFEGCSLVVDAFEKNHTSNVFSTKALFNDKKAEKGRWTPLTFEGMILDNFQQFDSIKTFIYNPGKQELKLRNARLIIEEYKGK